MRNIITILAFLVSMAVFGQASSKYQRLGKLTTSEINAIDVTNSNYVYTAYDTTLGIEVINTGSGWVPRKGASSFTDIEGSPYDNTALGDALDLKADASAIPPVINNLTSTSTTSALSAAQGKVLQDGKFPYTGGIITGTTNIQLTDYDYRLGPSGFQLKANALSSPNNGYFTIRRLPLSNNYDIVTPSGVASTGSSKIELVTVNNTVETGDPTAVVAIVKGRMKGVDGIDSDDYATVGQISGGGTDDQTASEVPFTPAGTISSTNVQDAIEELGTEKASNSGIVHLAGPETITGVKTFNTQTYFTTSILLRQNVGGGNIPSPIAFAPTTNDMFSVAENTNSSFWMRGDYLNWKNPTQLDSGARFTQDNTGIRTYTLPDASGGVLISDTSEITGSDQITNLVSATASEIESDPPASTTLAICSDCAPATIVTSATIDLDSKDIMFNDSSDAATITFNNAKAGSTAYIYINRSSAPTLAGSGLTFNPVPGSAAFASNTDMVICFHVRYDGTTVDYYYLGL